MISPMSVFIKTRRCQIDMTQLQLARAIGLDSGQLISNIERGVMKLPNAQIKSISKALRLVPEEIVAIKVQMFQEELRAMVQKP